MFALHIGLRQWLRRWLGSQRDNATAQPAERTQEATNTEPGGPLFSLGDTKQDVVVSYRPLQAEES